MEKFKKLSRAEMKKVKGGDSCQNECGGVNGTCGDGEKCDSVACSDDPNFTHAVCVPKT